MLNQPVDLAGRVYMAQVRQPGGFETLYLTRAQVDELNANPDAYAAAHFGMTLEQYTEWIELDGAPLCGAMTQAGAPCKQLLGRIQMPAGEWLALHREEYCHVHGGRQ